MATKKYESLRIMSLEGSVVFKNDGFTATKDGKPDPQAFRGILDESIDTLKLAEVYAPHEDEIGYPYLDGKKRFCRAVVSLSFNRAIKLYESYGIHYVRYKRSAGASRDGRCLFIAEPLYADMMAWSSCDLSADTASDQASWQAYIALTLSSIENVIKLPKKSILIIRDRVSRFTENVICVKETDTHDLRAEEEETEIENVIWDGEALLDAEIFNVNGYGMHGMMLLRNRFFKTCAFNTNLQDWFFDNDITQVSRLAGYTTARDIKDIKLVITESSVKYFKFMPKGYALRAEVQALSRRALRRQ